MDIDAVGELLDLRTEILGARGADERACGDNRQRASRLCSHDVLPSFESGDLPASVPQFMPSTARRNAATTPPIACKEADCVQGERSVRRTADPTGRSAPAQRIKDAVATQGAVREAAKAVVATTLP